MMNKVIPISISLLILFSLFIIFTFILKPQSNIKSEEILNKDESIPNPLRKIEKYNIYYGVLTSEILEDMKNNYELMILDSYFIEKEQVKYLKENGVIVYGYISLSHIGNWDRDLINKLDSKDYFLRLDEKIVYDEEGHLGDIGDIRHNHYQEVLLGLIKERVVDKGFDGVFLDTPEYYELPEVVGKENVEELTEASIKFIGKIKEKFPTVSIFQNRGFKILDKGSKKYIDAILYEDFNAERTSPYYLDINDIINNAKKDYDIECFALSTLDNIHQLKTARSYGWKFQSYNEIDNYIKWSF